MYLSSRSPRPSAGRVPERCEALIHQIQYDSPENLDSLSQSSRLSPSQPGHLHLSHLPVLFHLQEPQELGGILWG